MSTKNNRIVAQKDIELMFNILTATGAERSQLQFAYDVAFDDYAKSLYEITSVDRIISNQLIPFLPIPNWSHVFSYLIEKKLILEKDLFYLIKSQMLWFPYAKASETLDQPIEKLLRGLLTICQPQNFFAYKWELKPTSHFTNVSA